MKIPNLRIKVVNSDPRTAVVINMDTGEPITNITAMKFDLDANRDSFTYVHLTTMVDVDVEYEGKVDFEQVRLSGGRPVADGGGYDRDGNYHTSPERDGGK